MLNFNVVLRVRQNQNSNNNRFHSSSPIKTQFNTLQKDTVQLSFKGGKTSEDYPDVERFSKYENEKFKAKINSGNEKYAYEIVNAFDKRLKCDDAIEVLDYFTNKKANVDEVKSKIKMIEGLEDIEKKINKENEEKAEQTKEKNEEYLYVPNLYDKLTSNALKSFLLEDVISQEEQDAGLDNFEKAFKITKGVIDSRYRKIADLNKDKGEVTKNRYLKNYMEKCKDSLPTLVFAESILGEKTLKDLENNRYRDFNTYGVRLRRLEKEDRILLSDISKKGKIYVTAADGSTTVSEMPRGDVLNCLNLLSCNKALKSFGVEPLKLEDYKEDFGVPSNPDIDYIPCFNQFKKDLLPLVLMTHGITKEELDSGNVNTNWDESFVYLLLNNDTSYKNELKDVVVKEATRNNFSAFIDEENELSKYGKANKATKRDFERFNLDYDKWKNLKDLKLTSKEFEFTVKLKDKLGKGEEFTVVPWNRIPQEDIFAGNYTTCCTGIDKENGGSFPAYMLNTAFNFIYLKNSSGKIVEMSRLMMVKDEKNQPALVVENIEVNNNVIKRYLNNDDNKREFRDKIFDYAREIAKEINKDEKRKLPVYFPNSHLKVEGINKKLGETMSGQIFEVIGSIEPRSIYINSFGGFINSISNEDLGENEFKANFYDITEKKE